MDILGVINLSDTGSNILETVKLDHQITPYFQVVSAPSFCCRNEIVL